MSQPGDILFRSYGERANTGTRRRNGAENLCGESGDGKNGGNIWYNNEHSRHTGNKKTHRHLKRCVFLYISVLI